MPSAERARAGDAGVRSDDLVRRAGYAAHATMPYPFEIRRSGDHLAFIHGWYRWFRLSI